MLNESVRFMGKGQKLEIKNVQESNKRNLQVLIKTY